MPVAWTFRPNLILTISLVETSDERFLRAVALDIPPVFGSI